MSSISPTSSSSGLPPVYLNGLVSGINTTQVIDALMQAVEQPQVQLETQRQQIQQEIGDYQAISGDLQSLQSASDQLTAPGALEATAASSSDPSVATATSNGSGVAGSVSFTVGQLAQADQMASSGSVSSTSEVVTSASSLLVGEGGSGLGLATVVAGSGLGLGNHTIAVTQASSAATATGSSPLASSTTISSSNDTLDVTADGTAYTLTLASGTYSSPSALAAALNAAATAAGAPLTASVDSSGVLTLATTNQGSQATLQVTGGTALGALGLATETSATTGTDAVVNVDGTATTISDVVAGGQLTLSSGSGGSVVATVGASGHLAVGSMTAANVSTGNGSLADVVQAINSADVGVTAAAVQTASDSYVLQLSSAKTGAANDLTIAPNAFASSGLGTLTTLQAGQDAEINVGGASGYSVTSATNTFSGLLPGLSVTVAATTSSPVTVSLAPDASGIASKLQAVVTAANKVLSDIQTYAGYNQQTKQAGPLMGDPNLSAITQQILATVADAVGPNGLTPGSIGLSVTSSGQLSFDQSTFESAFAANPTGVAALLGQGGSFAPASGVAPDAATFLSATDGTAPGSYAIEVSHSATQATDLGAVLSSGAVSTAETLTFDQGGASVSYATTAGQSLSSIAAGLNQAFAGAGLSLAAEVTDSGDALQVTSDAYGSQASFSVTSTDTGSGTTGLAGTTANTPVDFTGTDVAGTIDGVTGVGQGQVLSAPPGNSTLAGLALTIGASGITSATSLGTFTYDGGVVGGLGYVANQGSNSLTGVLTTTIAGLQAQSNNLENQITAYDPIINAQRQAYQEEFAQMEATLSTLKSQQSWLTSAVAGLS